jgi:putative membrane protein
MEEDPMMYWGTGMGGWGMLLTTIGGLMFWGLIITGIVVLVRSSGRGALFGPPAGQASTPQQVLADRFARGEIDEDQYTRRLHVLAGALSPRSGPVSR